MSIRVGEGGCAVAFCFESSAAAAGVVLATNHHLRNLETHRAIKECLAAKALGHLEAATLSFTVGLPDSLARRRRRSSQEGGGVLLDLTVHTIDLLRFYFDAEPISIKEYRDPQHAAAVG